MSTPWERIEAGRYATTLNGHVLQVIRSEEPYQPNQRPYVAVVDRVPLPNGAWSVAQAKTQAINAVLNRTRKPKGEKAPPPTVRLGAIDPPPCSGSAGRRRNQAELGASIDAMLDEGPPDSIPAEPEPPAGPPAEPFPEPEPDPEPDDVPDLDEEIPAYDLPPQEQPQERPGHVTVTGRITDPDLIGAIAALRETITLMREVCDVECTIILPPVLKL